jgi:TIR domain
MSRKRSKVFISYAREDFETAQQFYDDVQKPGIEPWLDTRDIESGLDWSKVIEQEISGSKYFLALISNKSLSKERKKRYVQYEWKRALEKKKPFIPIRLEPCTLPKRLSALQWVDLFPASAYEDGLRKILRRLNGAKTRANFEETFSSLGPDNDGWDLSEWNLSNVDHTGKGSKSIYGEAVPNFNTVTKAAYIALDIGKSTTLQFYRRLKLRRANIMAKANFKAIINDGAEHIIDEESQELESDWLKRTIDLSPYGGKTITLKFVVTATDPLSLTSYAKAWIDTIVIFNGASFSVS